MRENQFTDKRYLKARAMRKDFRQEIFEKNRKAPSLSYLEFYDDETKKVILNSIDGPIPASLPPVSQVVRSTISYYRRSSIPVWRTRLEPGGQLDPHMTYESLWSLSSHEDITQFSNYTEMVKEYERDLPMYLAMPYPQIREAAIIVAGNRALGNSQDILKLVGESDENIWVMVNHIFEIKIDEKILFNFISKGIVAAFRTLSQMTNKYRHQIIFLLIENEEIMTAVIDSLNSSNPEIQDYSMQIIGNILAEPEDYSCDLTKYHLLDKIYPLLSNKKAQIRQTSCWLLANYAYENGAANQVICKQNILERIFMMFKNQHQPLVRRELYYVLINIRMNADKVAVYRILENENILEKCSDDLEIDNMEVVECALNFIHRTIELGDEVLDDQEQIPNPFITFIKNCGLKAQIQSKTYSQNQNISNTSISIMEKLDKNERDDLGMI